MNISGVIVCVGFSDFLATTLPRNRDFFDRLCIVTEAGDTETQKLAYYNDCTTVITDRHKQDGHPFNKGRAINCGLDELHNEQAEWICHIDADIVLPTNLRQRISGRIHGKQSSDPTKCIFGIHRYMCESYVAWKNYLDDGSLGRFYLENKRHDRKHLPVGFFQLWHSSMNARYPTNYETATTSDLEFAKQFGKNRYHLDEYCIHLSSIKHERGTDWKGRTSPKWGDD